LSRIWDALKQAEREKSLGQPRDAKSSPVAAVDESDRRKNLRHAYSAQLLVYGADSDKQPFHEDAETIDAHDEGCMIELESTVLEGQRLFLVHSRTQAEQQCRVVRVGDRVGGKARVAVVFDSPAPHFWRIS
jgi:hypothetical protein